MNEHQHNRNSKSRSTYFQKYSVERMKAIKRLIQNFEAQGRQKQYSISIDGEVVIPKGTPSDKFDDYTDFIEPHTERIDVRLYFGNSPNFKQHSFQVAEPSLSGLDSTDGNVNEKIAQALERQELEMENERLRKELKRKTKKLRRYRQYEEENEGKSLDLNGLVTKGFELFGNIKQGKPALETDMAGLESTKVEFEDEQTESEKLFAQLKATYPEKALLGAIELWEILIKHPQLREEFSEIINKHNK